MRIADALALRTSGRNSRELRRETRRIPEAYSLYASGRFAFTRLTEATLLQAIWVPSGPSGAIQPTRSPTLGSLSSYSLLAVIGSRAPREVFPLARAAADRSLSLDPQLAAAYTARAQIRVVYSWTRRAPSKILIVRLRWIQSSSIYFSGSDIQRAGQS